MTIRRSAVKNLENNTSFFQNLKINFQLTKSVLLEKFLLNTSSSNVHSLKS